MIIRLQIWRCPIMLSLNVFCLTCVFVRLDEGGWKNLITIRHCVFITLRASAVSQAHPGTLSHCRSRCLGLPTRWQVLFILICIMHVCSESCFCWNLKSQVLAARAWSDLLEIWTQRRDTPQPSVTGYPNMTVVWGIVLSNPPVYLSLCNSFFDFLFHERYFLKCYSHFPSWGAYGSPRDDFRLSKSKEDCN